MAPRTARPARLLALLVVLALVVLGGIRTWQAAAAVAPIRAADALPVYLAAAAVRDGGDPTTQEGLQAAYDRRQMQVRAATFSNLYPATTGVLLSPLAAGSWERFVPLWRGLLLLGAVLAGAGGGLAAVRGRNAALGAAIGAWLALAAFPVTTECISLGQANLLIAGLLGLCMAGISRSRPEVAAVAAVLGAGIKLVPGIVGWTLLMGRRWRALGVAVAAGLVLLLLTLPSVPFDRIISGVIGTLRFQGAIFPDWLHHGPTPDWMRSLGDLRHAPLMLVTLALMGAVAWVAGSARDRRASLTLAGTVALAAAWLGADSAGFHVLYAPLYLPALAWVSCWPLDEDAPPWSIPFALVAAAPTLLLGLEIPGLVEEARLVLAGLLIWLATLVRLLWTAPVLPVPALAVVGLAIGWGIATVDQLDEKPRGPDPASVPGGDVTGIGLPEGVGHGGPQPGGGALDGSPAETAGVVNAPARSAPVAGTGSSGVLLEEVLKPGQAGRLTSHLVQSPKRWASIDDPLAAWLVAEAPKPPAALVAYGPLVRWMAWEKVAIERLPGTDAQAAQWERTWAALSSTD